jgi:hypothetical protein
VTGSGRLVSTAAAAGLVLVVAGCGGGDRVAMAAVGQSSSPVRPTVVGVACDANATITTTSTAVVDRDGLHLKVIDRSGAKGVYLNFAAGATDGPGGGEPVRVGTTERVLPVPPGDVYLDCSFNLGAETTASVKVRAIDPNGYYRPVTLAELGCSPSAPVDWLAGPERGKTGEAALGALVVASRQRLHARLTPIGYVGSGVRTYILERDGIPWATAAVSSDAGEYVAYLDNFC